VPPLATLTDATNGTVFHCPTVLAGRDPEASRLPGCPEASL
jgi:hypothetical protein